MPTDDRLLARGLPVAVLMAVAGALAAPARAQPVVVATARTIPFPITVEALGTARASEAVEIRSQISERVTAIRFE